MCLDATVFWFQRFSPKQERSANTYLHERTRPRGINLDYPELRMLHDPLATSTLAVGILLGLRHALDADHLAAISTILAGGKSWKRAGLVGLVWGVGHTTALVGVALLVIFLGVRVPPEAAVWLEFAVGLTIVALGGRLALRASRGRLHVHAHRHGDVTHVHPHEDAATAETHHPLPKLSFAVGLLHGVAGSAALMLVVLSTIETTTAALLYVALFGVGSILGMAAMSSAMAVPLSMMGGEWRAQAAIGGVSAIFGAFYVANALGGI